MNKSILFVVLQLIFISFLFGQERDEQKQVEARVGTMVNDFQNHLIIIADKRIDTATRNANIEAAEKFFHPDAEIETSSKFRKVKGKDKYTVYLRKLRDLPQYDQVILRFDEFTIETNKIRAGFYKISATYRQRFFARKTDKEPYCDLTYKIIDITAKITTNEHGREIIDIKFNNITVDKTIDDCK